MTRSTQVVMRCIKTGIIFALMVSVLGPSHVALAGKYFDKEDEKGLEHLSGALMAWYETNQLGQPKNDKDVKRLIDLLDRVFVECTKVPDKTLKKIDAGFANQFRENLQNGAHLFGSGMKSYWAAKKNGDKLSDGAKSDMNEGQQRMVRFHNYYNANIERIVKELKKNGVDIFG